MTDRALSVTIPPPTMGWNTKDPISEMDQLYAVEAINFFSNGGTVDARKGTYNRNTEVGTYTVNTIAELALQDGSLKMIGISQGIVYDTTNPGSSPTDLSAGSTKLVSGSEAATLNFRNKLFIKDLVGTNDVWYWDGASASITAAGFTGPGGDDKLLYNIQSYKSRLYFTGNDLSVWYGGVDAITGALTQFDMQSIFTKGGKLLFAGSSAKTGDSQQEYFTAISTQGEILVYQGDYPGSTTWSLVGHYYGPNPVGYRSFFYWGASLILITYQGVLPLSEIISGSNELAFLSDKISSQFISALTDLPTAYSNTVCGVFCPSENLIMINVVRLDTLTTEQFVMSTINRSWWRWIVADTQFQHLAIYDKKIMAGYVYGGLAHGAIYQYLFAYTDVTPTGNQAMALKLRCAFNYLGDRAHVKNYTSARPVLYQSGGLSLTLGNDVDFSDTVATSTETNSTTSSYVLYQPTCGLTGMGKCVSIRIDGSILTRRMSLQAIEVFYTQGGLV